MSYLCITGGKPLGGSVQIQGSKNAALPMMAACFLSGEPCVLEDCPLISDVLEMEKMLSILGAETRWEGHDLYIDAGRAQGTKIPRQFTEKMRSSVILLGAVLARNHRCTLGYPGGCVIGKRPIDCHIHALRCLGAEIEERDGLIRAACRGFTGTEVTFDKISVGATQQGILGAVTARGRTVLCGCAKEPEIIWLCRLLRRMGANITGDGTRQITIDGVSCLKGVRMSVPPDRIVAGTWLCALAATRGKGILYRFPVEELYAFLEVYRKMGGQYREKSGKLIVNAQGICHPLPYLRTEGYPGFPTDLQSPVMAVLATIPGRSIVEETIFEDRFKAVEEMRRMGAQIQIRGTRALIDGGQPVRGCRVTAQELRGGAALAVLALAAEGETRIDGYAFIRRGYEAFDTNINALGGRADIQEEIHERVQLSKESSTE